MPEMTSLGRWLIILGLSIAGIGGFLWVLSRAGLPLGRLPGDFRFQSGNLTCFIPLATSILFSIFLTLVINLIARRMK